MYTDKNFASKKAVKDAIAVGEKIRVFQPNNIFGVIVPTNGPVFLEGPHYPKPHRWYGQGEMKDGFLVKIKWPRISVVGPKTIKGNNDEIRV